LILCDYLAQPCTGAIAPLPVALRPYGVEADGRGLTWSRFTLVVAVLLMARAKQLRPGYAAGPAARRVTPFMGRSPGY
jgi:hypothetical protein